MGKGVAFGKKVGQTVSAATEAKAYSLKEMTERGDAKDIIKSVSPLCLELANEVLSRAEKEFEKVDRTILFTNERKIMELFLYSASGNAERIKEQTFI